MVCDFAEEAGRLPDWNGLSDSDRIRRTRVRYNLCLASDCEREMDVRSVQARLAANGALTCALHFPNAQLLMHKRQGN